MEELKKCCKLIEGNQANFFMQEAIKEAKKAYKKKEVPIGAVIVYKNKIIARGYNLRESKNSSLLHAEIVAIEKACKKMKSWRLDECDMYITLEPCPMCAGAIIQSRIKNIFFGAKDFKSGCVESKVQLFKPGIFNHDVNVTGGLLESECSQLLKDFFSNLRKVDKVKKL